MPHPLVLMYHGFGRRPASADPQNLFVPADALERQLTSLLRRGFRPLDEAAFLVGLERGQWPARSFLVTIDDGYVSTLDIAAPLLSRLHVPAVLFALAGMLGGTSEWMPEMPPEPLLDRTGLRELRSAGISVGVHGLDHTSLSGRDAVELRRQTAEARACLADVVGYAPTVFAYPFGDHDAPARQAVAAAGFAAAFAIYDRHGQHALPRVDVNAIDTDRTFRLKTSRVFPPAKALLDRAPGLRRLAHTAVGRARR